MEKEYFLNDEISLPQPLEFENTMSIAWNGVNCNAEQSFLDHSNSSIDRYSHLESALCSMVSSPAPSNSGLSSGGLALHELIGKLGGIGVFPPASSTATAASPYTGTNNNSTNNSCHATPLNSPLKLNLSILDEINMPNSVPLTPLLPVVSADPDFVERAAIFSSSGSQSFNSRITQFRGNNADLSQHIFSTPLMENGKSSSPCLKKAESLVETMNLGQEQIEIRPANEVISGSDKKVYKLRGPCANSNEESSVSEKIPGGGTGSIIFNDLNSRKRKTVCRGKSKEDASTSTKGLEGNEDVNAKRSKPTQSDTQKNACAKAETEGEGIFGNENDKQKSNQMPPEPPKDYIHVRARRGQATDSHSLAERVRREKISERMKLLQDLVPGCNKVTGKALMLDEIINYVQSLQCQVEFLSMKLSSVNPGQDFNINNLLSKDMFQQNATQPQQMLYPLDSSAPAFYNHQPHQNVQQQMDPLPSLHRIGESLPQFLAFGEDDLNSIVQMSYSQNPVKEAFHPHQKFPVPNMKVRR